MGKICVWRANYFVGMTGTWHRNLWTHIYHKHSDNGNKNERSEYQNEEGKNIQCKDDGNTEKNQVIELPIKHPELFESLGTAQPKMENIFDKEQGTFIFILSGRGNIVFISSTAGVMALDVGSIYSASKGAMNQLTRNLACEWAKDNIRFYQNGNFEEHARARTQLRRIGEVEEVSSMVAFLCLPAASYITGQVHVIDGGATINAFYPAHD